MNSRQSNAFCVWLAEHGWTGIRTEVDFIDVVAEREGTRLYGEAKGRTSAIGLDVDTMYGQILWRMPFDDDPDARFAVVVPEAAVQAALRVSSRVRRTLKIEVYGVDDEDGVRLVE
jgi:hypothetical protein